MKIYGKRGVVVRQSSIRKESILDRHDWEEGRCRRGCSRSVANVANDVVFAWQAADRDGFVFQLRILGGRAMLSANHSAIDKPLARKATIWNHKRIMDIRKQSNTVGSYQATLSAFWLMDMSSSS